MSLHGFSKFLRLNNFFLGTMKKLFYDFFQKCLSLNKIIIFTPYRQKKPIFSKGHRGSSIFFLSSFLPIKLEQNIKKSEISSSRGIYRFDVTQCEVGGPSGLCSWKTDSFFIFWKTAESRKPSKIGQCFQNRSKLYVCIYYQVCFYHYFFFKS